MKQLFLFLIATLVTIGAWAQSTVQIEGKIFNSTSNEVKLAEFVKGQFVNIGSAKLGKEGAFKLTAKIPQSDYYVLRVNEGTIYLILRDNASVQVYSDAKNIGKFTNFVNSDESAALHNFSYIANDWNKVKNDAIQRMQKNPELGEKINEEIQPVFREFQQQFQAFFQENQNSPALIATLSVIDATNEFESFEMIANTLNANFPQSKQVKEVMETYAQVKKKKDAENMFAPGKEAPDFEELMLDRTTKMKLSDLRGKVVLLDFWASWCGPCRRENPNVVNVYNKYKDKGFTVMSVSLDDNMERWQQAIEQDGLIWPNHVSDLKKWQSAVGRIYKVNSIPFTVLIDKEGRIIQTNLRGPALEEMVAKLLN